MNITLTLDEDLVKEVRKIAAGARDNTDWIGASVPRADRSR